MSLPLFCSLDSAAMVSEVQKAERSICYAAPGIHTHLAQAIVDASNRIGPELITICLDFDEAVLRMGFGDIKAVELLRNAEINISTTPGLRTGLIVIDQQGFIFTPTALYLEDDKRSVDAPNAMRLSKNQVTEALTRLSPAAKAIAIATARTSAEKKQIREQAVEVPSVALTEEQFNSVEEKLALAPPAPFDISRQVRVFSAYMQYVELSLTGVAIEKCRYRINPEILPSGASKEIQDRIKTSFELIEAAGELSSKKLNDRLVEIRNNYTRSLVKTRGRVVLQSAKPHLESDLEKFRVDLENHQKHVENELQLKLDASKQQIIEHCLPNLLKHPTPGLRGGGFNGTEEHARAWLDQILSRDFPRADKLIKKMKLEVHYKDVTFETLNKNDFLQDIKKCFPLLNWEKTFSEFKAVGERD